MAPAPVTPPPLWDTERIDGLIGWTLIRTHLVRVPHFFRVLQAVDLTPTQFGVLVQLDNSPGISQAELARRSLMTPQSMGEVLHPLERAGYVQRGATPGRGRPIPVSLTDEGREALARATPQAMGINTPEAFGLTEEECHILNVLLHKVIRHTEAGPGG